MLNGSVIQLNREKDKLLVIRQLTKNLFTIRYKITIKLQFHFKVANIIFKSTLTNRVERI